MSTPVYSVETLFLEEGKANWKRIARSRRKIYWVSLTKWRVQKCWRVEGKAMYQLRRTLSQMHIYAFYERKGNLLRKKFW